MEKVKVSKLFAEIEMPLTKVLAKMEIQGIQLNTKMLNDYALILSKEIEQITKKILVLSGEDFNIASPKQLGKVLFEKMELVKKAKKTKRLLDKKTSNVNTN